MLAQGKRDLGSGVKFLFLLVVLFSVSNLFAQLNPLSQINPPLAGQNINWNYNMGYSFTPSSDGDITQLGGRWTSGITHTVRLYNQSTGTVLASVNVTGNGSYNYATLASSIAVTAGTNYVVAVRLNNQTSGCYSNDVSIAMPFTSGGITVNNCRYSSGTNAMPTTTNTTNMYGIADVTFVPCAYAGTVSSSATLINQGDSVTLTSLNNVGSIQWQISTDGTNFTDIVGATGSVLNSGVLNQRTYYRTRTTSTTCTQSISSVVIISIDNPFYPLQNQSPNIAGQNNNWNYNLGYRFTAMKNGNVTELGGRWANGTAHTVRLYAYPAGTLLASTTVTGSMNWSYNSIAPVALTAGNQYVVAVRCGGTPSASYSTGLSFPISTTSDIRIDNATYASATNAMPTNSITTAIYGLADIRFEPCEFAGNISGATHVTKWDSTILTVNNHVGSIQWQISTDGTNYTNILGATSATLNTGGLANTSWFRTIISPASCGGDTSNAWEISVFDPGYPLRNQNPNITSSTVNWNFNMGYRFTANSNGNVTQLGGRWGIGATHTVRLYAYPAGTLLASSTITSLGDWTYAPITPVALTGGSQYVVAVRLGGANSSTYGPLSTPVTSGQITINNSTYVSGSNAMPTNSVTNYMYGFADIKFEPCVYAGYLQTNDSLICSGANSTINVFDSEGSIQWQQSTNGVVYTNIVGATDTAYTATGLTSNTFFRAYTTDACGSDTSGAIEIEIIGGGLAGRWNASIDNDWNNGCNWESGNVPVTGDSVFIPFGIAPPINNPVISLSYLQHNNLNSLVLSNDLTITGQLRLMTGNISLGSNNLILDNSATVTGAQSTAFVDASGTGEFRKMFNSTGTPFTVPLGGNSQYTPIEFTLNNSSTLAGGAYASFRSVDMNHPNLGTPTNRISRYWVIGGANIPTLNYNASFQYADIDIVGAEASIVTRFRNSSAVWSSFSNANTASNLLVANGATEFGDFTGGDDLPFQTAQTGNWSNAATWQGGVVPAASNDVSILSGHVVTLTSSADARSVSINAGATLNAASNQINVSGNWVNSGTFDGTGTVNMNGTAAQQITGISSFDVLRIDNAAGVTSPSSTTEITGRIEIENGNFHTGNNLTLISTPTQTASLAEVKGSISGSLTAQRNIDGTTVTEWRHLTSPIIGSTLNDFKRDASTNPGGIHFFGFPGSNYPNWHQINCLYFSEANAGGANNWNSGWVNPTDITEAIGYNNPITFWTGSSAFPFLNLKATGAPNVGTVTMNNLSFTASNTSTGWHMIGNPYPSPIDWAAVTKSGVDAIAYIWTNGGWTASNLLGDEISSFQGFYVHLNNGTNSITFEENDKVNTQVPYHKNGKAYNRLKFTLTGGTSGKTTLAAVDFNPTATNGFDSNLDALLVPNGNAAGMPELGFIGDKAVKMQVQTIAGNQIKQIIPMHFKGNGTGQFTLKIEEFASANYCFVLNDKKEGKNIAITLDSSYSFSSTSVADTNRFELIIQNTQAAIESKDAVCFGETNGQIVLDGQLAQVPSVLDINNKAITLSNQGGKLGAYNLQAGIYKVEYAKTNACPSYTSNQTINEPLEITADFLVNHINGHKYEFTNLSKNASEFIWDFGDGTTDTNSTMATHVYPGNGLYNVVLKAKEGTCSKDKKHELKIAPGPIGLEENLSSNRKIFTNAEGVLLSTHQELNEVTIQVFDVAGKRLYSNYFDNLSAGKHQIWNESPSQQVLLIQVSSNQWQASQRVVH